MSIALCEWILRFYEHRPLGLCPWCELPYWEKRNSESCTTNKQTYRGSIRLQHHDKYRHRPSSVNSLLWYFNTSEMLRRFRLQIQNTRKRYAYRVSSAKRPSQIFKSELSMRSFHLGGWGKSPSGKILSPSWQIFILKRMGEGRGWETNYPTCHSLSGRNHYVVLSLIVSVLGD